MSDPVSQQPNPKYAWRELAHKSLPKRSASERVADFLEIYGLYDEATAREQASRCIQCPNPSCVTGCPMCNPIPQWMLLTAEGRFLEASAVLGSGSPFRPRITTLGPSTAMTTAKGRSRLSSLTACPAPSEAPRSEERRVGKECRSRWSP